MSPKISAADIRTYREEGAVCLRQVIDPAWLAILADGVDQARAAPGSFAREYAKPGEGSFFTDHRMFARFEPFRRFAHDGPGAAIAAQVLGATRLILYDEHLLVKEPGTEVPTTWHQDMPYLNAQGEQMCSMWLSLDPVSEDNGALRFVTASHRWGKLFMPVDIGSGATAVGDLDPDIDGPVPDIDAHPELYPTVCYPVEPGDCVVFHGCVLHSSSGNASKTLRRRALSLRYCGDDVTWKSRSKASKIFATMLRDGDPIDREECPPVWPRRAAAAP